MRIQFLGTSASWPLPRLGCSCEICKSTDPKDKRTRSQLLVNDILLLDAGPDTYLHLAKVDPKKIVACIITHKHWDHVAGISDLKKIYNRKKPIQVISAGRLARLMSSQWRSSDISGPAKLAADIRTKGEKSKLRIDGLKVEIFPVEHGNVSTCGVKITEGKKSLVYAPDFRTIPANSAKICQNVGVLIIGGSSLGNKGRAQGHETIIEGIVLGKKLRASKVYFTHIGHSTGKHQDLESFVKRSGSNFHIAYDGLTLEF